MKTTGKQLKTINSIQSILQTWKSTNDFNSPTHEGDIREFLVCDLLDDLSEEELDEIEEKLISLLNQIRKIK